MPKQDMITAVQPRTLKTRARLIEAAETVIQDTGHTDLRVEEVVKRAGVAKGTFFAHFKDKETLLALLLGTRMDAYLDDLEAGPAPATISDLVDALLPLMRFMTCERYVFDVILRHSGAAALEDIGAIANALDRFIKVSATWFGEGPFRQDATPTILAEGVQAFMFQAMALNFCALTNTQPLPQRLMPYFSLWLLPPKPLDSLG